MPVPKIKSMEEALLTLSDGLMHSARNPNIKHYKPHEKQAIFHKSTKQGKLYIGGNRSGKTVGGVCEDIWRATCKHPYRPDLNLIGPNRGRVVAVDFTQGVEKIIFPQFKQWLYPSALRGGAWEAAYDKTLRMLTFSNGSFIEFMSYDQDLDKFAGTSRHWIHYDEEPPKNIYRECSMRLIDTNGDWHMTMTPVDGMTWVYDDIYEPNIKVEEKDRKIAVISIGTYENPYLSQQAITNVVSDFDEDEQLSRVSGQFVAVGGLIYKNFDPVKGGNHVLSDPLDLSNFKNQFKDYQLVMSLDHGLNNPTGVLWHLIDRNGRIITFYEHYKKDWVVKQHAGQILRINRLIGRTPDLCIADPSIQSRNPITGTSVQEEYLNYGIPFILGNNDVEAGLIRVKGYLRPSPLNDGKPLWQLTPNCAWLIWEMKKYRYKVYQQKKLNYENNAYELPQKKDDHLCDALRYFIMSRPDLRAQDETFANEISLVMRQMDLGISRFPDDVADPNNLGTDPLWRPNNNVPNRFSDDGAWEVDEHLGGVM